MARPKSTRRRLLEFALTLPGAWPDHPWDEDVAKVGKKVFAFFGHEDSPAFGGMTVKLDESHDQALTAPRAEPSGYGLGKWGWVSVPFVDGTPPLDVLRDWIEESYRRIAPKDLVTELERRLAHR